MWNAARPSPKTGKVGQNLRNPLFRRAAHGLTKSRPAGRVSSAWPRGRSDAGLLTQNPVRARVEVRKPLEGDRELVPEPGRQIESTRAPKADQPPGFPRGCW